MQGLRTAWVFALLAAGGAGCVSPDAVHSTAWLNRLRQPAGPTGPDVVILDVALIERPAGDAYLNRDLWDLVDEQVIALEQRAALSDNGFRVGQVGGITPVGLQSLLASERSCANPRRLRMHAGKPTTLHLGPPAALLRWHLDTAGSPRTYEAAQADSTFEVVPTLTAAGRTRLSFTPQVLHGETALLPRPAADRSGWILQEQRPTERFDALQFDVELAPNDFLVIGALLDRSETLGYESFVRLDGPAPVQRLLVVRACRLGPLAPDDDPPLPGGDEAVPAQSPPLALQAAFTTYRGSSP